MQVKTPVKTQVKTPQRTMRPAITPDARENQMIAAAVDLAAKQLLDGTASSQVITHFLKLGSSSDRIDREIKMEQKKLIEAKTSALKSAQRIEELYASAIAAMRRYGGHQSDEDESYER